MFFEQVIVDRNKKIIIDIIISELGVTYDLDAWGTH